MSGPKSFEIKRLRGRWMRARDALGRAARLYLGLFAHWRLVKPQP